MMTNIGALFNVRDIRADKVVPSVAGKAAAASVAALLGTALGQAAFAPFFHSLGCVCKRENAPQH